MSFSQGFVEADGFRIRYTEAGQGAPLIHLHGAGGLRLTPGHVPWHQSVLVEDRGETAAFIADLMPTAAHLPLPWIMGYDLEPLRTLESKRALLRDAERGGWRLIFEHDPTIASGVVVAEGKGFGLREITPAGKAVAPTP